MSRRSGFVSIQFQVAGKILVAIGLIGSGMAVMSSLGQMFTLPLVVTLGSLVAVVLGLYLIFVVPREELE